MRVKKDVAGYAKKRWKFLSQITEQVANKVRKFESLYVGSPLEKWRGLTDTICYLSMFSLSLCIITRGYLLLLLLLLSLSLSLLLLLLLSLLLLLLFRMDNPSVYSDLCHIDKWQGKLSAGFIVMFLYQKNSQADG